SYDAALRSLDESLARLQLDHVDVALVHDPDDNYDAALAGAFAALSRLRDEGAVRAIGVGMNQVELLCRFAREADPDCVLVGCRSVDELEEDHHNFELELPAGLWDDLA